MSGRIVDYQILSGSSFSAYDAQEELTEDVKKLFQKDGNRWAALEVQAYEGGCAYLFQAMVKRADNN